MAAVRIRKMVGPAKVGSESFHELIMFQCPWDKRKVIAIIINTSPIRFVNMVIIPLFRDVGVW